MNIVDSLLVRFGWRRDGSCPERAIVIASVSDEYALLRRRYPEFKLDKQFLREIEGKPYDVLALRNASGETKELYFDVSSFLGKE